MGCTEAESWKPGRGERCSSAALFAPQLVKSLGREGRARVSARDENAQVFAKLGNWEMGNAQ